MKPRDREEREKEDTGSEDTRPKKKEREESWFLSKGEPYIEDIGSENQPE